MNDSTTIDELTGDEPCSICRTRIGDEPICYGVTVRRWTDDSAHEDEAAPITFVCSPRCLRRWVAILTEPQPLEYQLWKEQK